MGKTGAGSTNGRNTNRAGHDGEFRWVRASALMVDKEYQRYTNKKAIDRIVIQYDPDVFGVIFCSDRANGEIAILDGQHRWTAAQELFGVDVVLPTFLMRGLTPIQEASIFWKLNRNRLPPSSADTFRARLAAEEPVAMKIRDITQQLDVVLQLYPQPLAPNEVGAFSALESLTADGSIVPVLKTIRSAWPREPGVMKAANLYGFQQFFRQFYADFFIDEKLGEQRMERLVSVLSIDSPRDIERRATMYQESLHSRKSTAMARSIYWHYQRGMKSSKLRLPNWGVDADDVRMIPIIEEVVNDEDGDASTA
jgi:hypothetical protein